MGINGKVGPRRYSLRIGHWGWKGAHCRDAITLCPSWVKLRRTQYEHMFSALPSNSDIARRSRHVSRVPTEDSFTAANNLFIRSARRPGGEIAPIMSTENNAGHPSVDIYTIFGCLVQTFSRWGIQYGVSSMSPLEQRLAAVTDRTANLIAQLIELKRLRDRLRKAQLAWRSRRIERRQKPRR
jgi:transposase-like protein